MSKENKKDRSHLTSKDEQQETGGEKKIYRAPRLVSHGQVKTAVVMSAVSEIE